MEERFKIGMGIMSHLFRDTVAVSLKKYLLLTLMVLNSSDGLEVRLVCAIYVVYFSFLV